MYRICFSFEECIESWIKDKENPRLIVIDISNKPRARKNSGTAYDMDNELLSKFKR